MTPAFTPQDFNNLAKPQATTFTAGDQMIVLAEN